MKYHASIKAYDPDDEESETFDTWDQAADWLKAQQPFFRGDLCSMKVNGDLVQFHGGHLVNHAPEPEVPRSSVFEDVLSTMAGSQAEFNRIFRPQSARPTNVATHQYLGNLGDDNG